jgi:hypothetical protein
MRWSGGDTIDVVRFFGIAGHERGDDKRRAIQHRNVQRYAVQCCDVQCCDIKHRDIQRLGNECIVLGDGCDECRGEHTGSNGSEQQCASLLSQSRRRRTWGVALHDPEHQQAVLRHRGEGGTGVPTAEPQRQS